MADRLRPTGARLPTWLARRLGMWSRAEQRACPHPADAVRVIGGDERNYRYRWQCERCGILSRSPREDVDA